MKPRKEEIRERNDEIAIGIRARKQKTSKQALKYSNKIHFIGQYLQG